MEPYLGLVDTGAESVLAASWLADLAGIDLSANTDKALVGIGGQIVEVVFGEVELRLHRVDRPPSSSHGERMSASPGTGSLRSRWFSANPASSISSPSPSTAAPQPSPSRTGPRSIPDSGLAPTREARRAPPRYVLGTER
jgi:hypothetical protein